MNIARLIITFACRRHCAGCCNTYRRIMANHTKVKLHEVAGYGEVQITGGEPMLDPERTRGIVQQLRLLNPRAKLYLYTAMYSPAVRGVVDLVDGIQFSIHAEAEPADIEDFSHFQDVAGSAPNKSFRLYVDDRVKLDVPVIPEVWSRVQFAPWRTEDELLVINHEWGGLPINERLLILV